MELNQEKALSLFADMLLIRTFETRVEELFKGGHLPGFVHSCVGQEAIAVGVCSCLAKSDYITSTHRGHGHALAKGISLNSIFAELYGRRVGTCRGKGGSMHIADFSIGMLGANGIVGGGFGIATGAAFASKYQQKTNIAVCFFGDGAVNKGSFHESLNFAGLHKLPVVFVCENNQYAQFTAANKTTSIMDIADRASSYGIAQDSIDGNDIIAVIEATTVAVERARSGRGPTLINMSTYRHSGHYVGDAEEYRSRDEVDLNRATRDPILSLKGRLLAANWLTENEYVLLEQDIHKRIEAANNFAIQAAEPDASEALTDVWTEAR